MADASAATNARHIADLVDTMQKRRTGEGKVVVFAGAGISKHPRATTCR